MGSLGLPHGQQTKIDKRDCQIAKEFPHKLVDFIAWIEARGQDGVTPKIVESQRKGLYHEISKEKANGHELVRDINSNPYNLGYKLIIQNLVSYRPLLMEAVQIVQAHFPLHSIGAKSLLESFPTEGVNQICYSPFSAHI